MTDHNKGTYEERQSFCNALLTAVATLVIFFSITYVLYAGLMTIWPR